MRSYLLTRVGAEQLKTILQEAGLEILADGGTNDIAGFLIDNRGWAQGLPLALICVLGSRQESDELVDREVVEVEGTPSSIIADPRLLDTLGKVVAEGVRREGFFVLDLDEFGLSPKTVQAVATAAGVGVVAGMKAVFGPAASGIAEN